MTFSGEQIHGLFFLNHSPSWTRQSNRLTFLFLVFWSFLSQCRQAQGYSRIIFCYNKNNYEGQRLNTKVFKNVTASSEFNCGAHCYQNSCFRSANFRKIPDNDRRENCELLHAVEWEELGSLLRNESYDYLIMLQPKRPSTKPDSVFKDKMVQFRLVGLGTPDDVLQVFVIGEDRCFWETSTDLARHWST